ncbi:response regulator transcription factor [Acidimicrobiaceae bacterium]|nr:response regulator transcription factor [Acidimicrobiaceae bacterium]
MIKAYINIEKKHEKVISCLNSYDLDSVDLDKIVSQSEVNLVCTSFSLYGKTKKDLSDIESASKPIPELIVANEDEFKQSIDLIKNPKIEVISSNSDKEEVIARFQSLLGDSSSEKIEFSDLIINLKTYEAKIENQLLDLTFMEYELLKFFVENQDNVWSREELLEKVWGYDYFGGARTVDVHVRRLRSKLGEKRSDWIKTVHSVGYKFN